MASGCASECPNHNHKTITVGNDMQLVFFNEGPACPGGRQLYLVTKHGKKVDMTLRLNDVKWQRLVDALSNILQGPPSEYYFKRPNREGEGEGADEDDFEIVQSENQPTGKHFIQLQMDDKPSTNHDHWLCFSSDPMIAIVQANSEVQSFFTHGF